MPRQIAVERCLMQTADIMTLAATAMAINTTRNALTPVALDLHLRPRVARAPLIPHSPVGGGTTVACAGRS
eukprot:2778366-Pleurochrysis_carterae.AAC.1